jgi:hypothetical protein
MRTKSHASTQLLAEAARLADPRADHDDGLVRRSFGVTVRAPNQDERSVEVVVSTDTLDAHGDVVDQDWDLKRYKRNPVVLFNHGGGFFNSPVDDLPIGYGKDVAVRGGQLEATLVFVDEKANPMAEKVWQGFRQKSLHAVSAGFRPHTVSREMTADMEFYRLSDNELYEISVCPMGANPDAVAKSKALAQLDSLAGPKTTKASPTPLVTPKETDMTLQELEDKIKALEAAATKSLDAHVVTTKALETATAKVTELTASLATSEKSLTEASAKLAATEIRAKTAEAAVIKAGVEALVGKKITPAESEEFIELATKQPELYTKMIAKRADLPTAVNTVVVPVEKGGAPTPISADAGHGEDLAAAIAKRFEAEDDEDAA